MHVSPVPATGKRMGDRAALKRTSATFVYQPRCHSASDCLGCRETAKATRKETMAYCIAILGLYAILQSQY